MDALHLTLLVSLGLAALAVVFFLRLHKEGAHRHAEHLSLLPLDGAPTTPNAERPHGLDDKESTRSP